MYFIFFQTRIHTKMWFLVDLTAITDIRLGCCRVRSGDNRKRPRGRSRNNRGRTRFPSENERSQGDRRRPYVNNETNPDFTRLPNLKNEDKNGDSIPQIDDIIDTHFKVDVIVVGKDRRVPDG